jgi:hypothetical protein
MNGCEIDGCVCPCHPPTQEQNEAAVLAAEYDAYVEAHQVAIRSLAQVIAANVKDNAPGDPANRYEWPESEAVAILQNWDAIRRAVGGT